MQVNWNQVASTTLIQKFVSKRTFKEFFKFPEFLVEIVWQKLHTIVDDNFKPKHLLWTLFYLNSKSPSDVFMATVLHTNSQTLRIHVEKVLNYLLLFLPEVYFFHYISKISFIYLIYLFFYLFYLYFPFVVHPSWNPNSNTSSLILRVDLIIGNISVLLV